MYIHVPTQTDKIENDDATPDPVEQFKVSFTVESGFDVGIVLISPAAEGKRMRVWPLAPTTVLHSCAHNNT